jgi:RNA polymerase sigma-70 factor (ECF subfamily)
LGICGTLRRLARINPTVVLLNGAVALGMSEGAERRLALVGGSAARAPSTAITSSRRARRYARRLGSRPAAADAYRRALALTANGIERGFLERRLAAL